MPTVGWVQLENLFSGQNFLPYSVGRLQAAVMAHGVSPRSFQHLPLVTRRWTVAQLLPLLLPADIVFFSLYVWNAELSLGLARALKALKPACLVVVGGPQVPEAAELWLRAHPEVDLTCFQEGEWTAVELLDTLLMAEDLRERQRLWASVPGLRFLTVEGQYVCTPGRARTRELDLLPSPYLSGVFNRLMEGAPPEHWLMLLETNRGCPYGCTFCDWGSATQSKLYSFSLERVCGELDWAAAHHIPYIFCCDANFGILERDLELVRHAAALKARTGYPRTLSLQSAKGNPKQLERVWRAVIEGGLNQEVALPMQTVTPETLRVIKRVNISLGAFQQMNQSLARDHILTYTDMILGLPEETYESFAESLSLLVEHGQHHRLQLSNLSVLPNAELAMPEARERFGLETIQSRMVSAHAYLQGPEEFPELQELVVSTRSMPAEDWRKTRVLAWGSVILHFHKLLQVPMVLLMGVGRLRFRCMLEALLGVGQEFPTLWWLRQGLEEGAQQLQAGGAEFCELRELGGAWLPADERMYVRLLMEGRMKGLYEEAAEVLEGVRARWAPEVEAEAVREAVGLNAWVMGGGQGVGRVWEGRYPVWEVLTGVMRGEPWRWERGNYGYELTGAPMFYQRLRATPLPTTGVQRGETHPFAG
ncbi:MAG: B12-binding domain-containing radical SAM protein [Myxococcota bacterium]